MDHIDAAIAADESAAVPRLIKAWMLAGARDARFDAELAVLMREIPDRLSGVADADVGADVGAGDGASDKSAAIEGVYPTPGCQHALWSALQQVRGGNGIAAATVLDEWLLQEPSNLLVHQLLQEELFWIGRSHWMRDSVERAAPHWCSTDVGYGSYLSLRAFACEEAGELDAAERYGRQAVEIDPADIWGTHAVAHVMLMKGQMSEGIDWLESLSANWGHANQMRHHLWWHVCLFLLEVGDYDRILSLLTSEVRNPESALVRASPAAAIDIENFASLLLRLELYGVDVKDLWFQLASVCANRIENHGNPFANVHDMMVLAATEQFDKAEQLLVSMRARFTQAAPSSLALAYIAAGIPACEAVLAHRRADYKSVLDGLGAARHNLHLMGASHAQRDVLYHLLVHAADKEGRDSLKALYLQDIARIGFCNVPARAAYRS